MRPDIHHSLLPGITQPARRNSAATSCTQLWKRQRSAEELFVAPRSLSLFLFSVLFLSPSSLSLYVIVFPLPSAPSPASSVSEDLLGTDSLRNLRNLFPLVSSFSFLSLGALSFIQCELYVWREATRCCPLLDFTESRPL